MKELIKKCIFFAFNNFTPLIAFYSINHYWGLKSAIAVSVIVTIIEIVYKKNNKKEISILFKYCAGMTLIFGAVDLYAQDSFLFKYESCVTNIITGLFFASSLWRTKPILQDFYEKTPNAKEITPERAVYFRFITKIWVGYFFVKAAAYFWVAQNYTIEQGLVIRTILGSGSFYLMLFLSTAGAKKIIPYLKKTSTIILFNTFMMGTTQATVLSKEAATKIVEKAHECAQKKGKLYAIVVVSRTGDELAKKVHELGTLADGIINALNYARGANELQYKKELPEAKRPKNLPEKIEGAFPIFLEGKHRGAIGMFKEQVSDADRDTCLKLAIE